MRQPKFVQLFEHTVRDTDGSPVDTLLLALDADGQVWSFTPGYRDSEENRFILGGWALSTVYNRVLE